MLIFAMYQKEISHKKSRFIYHDQPDDDLDLVLSMEEAELKEERNQLNARLNSLQRAESLNKDTTAKVEEVIARTVENEEELKSVYRDIEDLYNRLVDFAEEKKIHMDSLLGELFLLPGTQPLLKHLLNLHLINTGKFKYLIKDIYDNNNPTLKSTIKNIRNIDPLTHKPYSSDLSPQDKKNAVSKGIIHLRSLLRNQYEAIANIVDDVYIYLDEQPEASILELIEYFLIDEVRKELHPDQLELVILGMQKAIERTRAINKYYPKFEKDPQKALEQLFDLKGKKLQGPVRVYKMVGSIHFNMYNNKDYALIYGDEKEAAEIVGFADNEVNITELNNTITVSKGEKGEELDRTMDHEERHQINKIIFSEFSEEKGDKPLVRAKNEIIARLYENEPLNDIYKIMSEREGVYDFFEEERLAAKKLPTEKRTRSLKYKWKMYKKRLKELLEYANEVKTPEDKIDIEMLSVAPVQHWKWL